MNRQECRRYRRVYPLLFILLAAVLAATSCSNPEKAKAEHVQRGEAFLKEKKFQEASLEFRNAIQIDERLAAAHWGLSQAYEGLGLFVQEVEELRRAIALDPDQKNLDARIKLGNLYLLASEREPKLKDEAAKLADAVLAKDPKSIEGHILMASVLFAQGERDRSLAELKQAVALDPNRIESILSLTRFYLKTGDTGKAEEEFKRAISINDNSSLAHVEYGKFLLQTNRPAEAEAQLQKAVAVDPQNRDVRRSLAGFYLVNKQNDKAEEAFKALADLDRDKLEGRAVLADFYASVGRIDEAVNIYKEINAKSPDYAQGRYRLGEILLQRGQGGDLDGALAQAEEMLKKNGNDRQALLLRSRILTQQGKPKAAIDDLKLVLKQDQHDQAGLYFIAQASLDAGQIEQARVFASDLEKYYPNYLPAKLMQVQISLRSSDFDAAKRLATELLDRLARTTPDPFNTPQLLAEIRSKTLIARASALLVKDKNPAAARADFEAARELQPNTPASYNNLAVVALAENKPDEAVKNYEHALSLDDTNFDALNGLVNLYARQNKLDQAQARVDQALAAKDSNASLHFLKSQIYGMRRDAAQAEAELRRTLELDPNFLPAFSSLAMLYVNTSQPDKAIAEYKQIAERRKDDPTASTAFTMIGMVQDGQKRYDDAAASYRSALAINQDTPWAANNLAWLIADTGRGNLDEAMRLSQGVVQKFPNVPSYADTLGWVYYKKGLYPAAVEQLQKAVNQTDAAHGNSALYRYHLGMALARKGDKAAARQALQQALSMNNGLPEEQANEARQALASL